MLLLQLWLQPEVLTVSLHSLISMLLKRIKTKQCNIKTNPLWQWSPVIMKLSPLENMVKGCAPLSLVCTRASWGDRDSIYLAYLGIFLIVPQLVNGQVTPLMTPISDDFTIMISLRLPCTASDPWHMDALTMQLLWPPLSTNVLVHGEYMVVSLCIWKWCTCNCIYTVSCDCHNQLKSTCWPWYLCLRLSVVLACYQTHQRRCTYHGMYSA